MIKVEISIKNLVICIVVTFFAQEKKLVIGFVNFNIIGIYAVFFNIYTVQYANQSFCPKC